ncbi:nucleotide exchange factor GrpE [Salinicoccus jeotgali]|uniref:Protein GrpE n=1 Tax=Salinicoccus jeotgali TaxID=381634 RepID=A0ABP7EBF5_9STAP
MTKDNSEETVAKKNHAEDEDIIIEHESTEQEQSGIEADSAEVVSDDESTQSEATQKDEEIEALKQKLEDEENRNLKLHAEFDNFKRRNRQEIENNNKYKHQKIVEDLLPIIDNFERALKIEGDSESFVSLHKGVEMVYNDLVNTLMKYEVTEVKSVGEDFDPNFHQAVMTESSDKEAGIILEEFQKGYILKDRVIRPSMVKVSE